MRDFNDFALFFHRNSLMALIFLTTGNKNLYIRLPVPAFYYD